MKFEWDGRRITTMELKDLSPLSTKEKEKAATLPIVYDDDCPPIPAEMVAAMEKEIQNRAAMRSEAGFIALNRYAFMY